VFYKENKLSTIKFLKFLCFSNFGFLFGGGYLIKLGKILHVSSSKNLILRAEVAPPLGAPVLTGDAREVGRIVDVFGPKKGPFVAVKSLSDQVFLQSLVGRVLFYREQRGMKAEHENARPRTPMGKRGDSVGS
jgi:rRNA processing protein Gar1